MGIYGYLRKIEVIHSLVREFQADMVWEKRSTYMHWCEQMADPQEASNLAGR